MLGTNIDNLTLEARQQVGGLFYSIGKAIQWWKPVQTITSQERGSSF
jgi:hypothetical protein